MYNRDIYFYTKASCICLPVEDFFREIRDIHLVKIGVLSSDVKLINECTLVIIVE